MLSDASSFTALCPEVLRSTKQILKPMVQADQQKFNLFSCSLLQIPMNKNTPWTPASPSVLFRHTIARKANIGAGRQPLLPSSALPTSSPGLAPRAALLLPAPSHLPGAAESQVLRREVHGPTNVWKSAQESSDKGHAWSTQRMETCVKVQGQGSASPARQVKQLLNSDPHQMLTDYLKHCRNEQKGHQDLSYTLNNP